MNNTSLVLTKDFVRARLISNFLFILLIAFILTFSISHTLDYKFGIKSVHALSACRAALLATAIVYLGQHIKGLAGAFGWLGMCMVAILAVAAISGLFRPNDWRPYVQHGFQYTFMLAFYLVGRVAGERALPPRLLSWLSATIIFAYAIGTTLFLLTPGLQSGSYSFQPNLALLPFSFGLSTGNYLMAGASAFLIVIGNKRAVLVGACFVAAVALSLFFFKGRERGDLARRTAAVLVLSPAFVLLSISGLSVLTNAGLSQFSVGSRMTDTTVAETSWSALTETSVILPEAPITPTKVAPMKLATEELPPSQPDPSEGPADTGAFVRLTSGRNVEANAIWELLKHHPNAIFTGYGLGARFQMVYTSPTTGELVDYTRDQADVLPVHVAMTSGVPLSIAFVLVLLLAYARVFFNVHRVDVETAQVALFVLGAIPDVLLGFNPTNPLIWAALGFALTRVDRLKPSPIPQSKEQTI
jgi:hypothetical protein